MPNNSWINNISSLYNRYNKYYSIFLEYDDINIHILKLIKREKSIIDLSKLSSHFEQFNDLDYNDIIFNISVNIYNFIKFGLKFDKFSQSKKNI
jgi:hypothetical protein